MRWITMIVAVCALVGGPAMADEAKALKVLYVTGGGYHDYPTQTKIITQGLEQRVAVDFTIKHLEGGLQAPAKHPAYEGADWARGYDLVIHNMCNSADVNDPAWVENIAQAHRNGVPAIFIHCAMHCFRATETETWRELVGVTTKNHEAHHPITVTRIAHTHPVMKNFPESWTTPKGELYRILKVWPGVTVLASGRAGEGQDHPVIWAHTYGKARVLGTTLGHFNEEVQSPEFLDLLTRGLLWATGKLEQEPPAPQAKLPSENRSPLDSQRE